MPNDPTLRSAVGDLLESDDNQLYEQLGIRARAMAERPETAGSFAPDVTYSEAQMGVMDDVRAFGKRLFARWNVEAWELVCGDGASASGDRDSLAGGFGLDKTTVAAALAGLLVSQLAVAPAIAAVVAAIVVKRFFRPAYQEFCSTWKGSLPANASDGGAAAGGGAGGGDAGGGGATGGDASDGGASTGGGAAGAAS